MNPIVRIGFFSIVVGLAVLALKFLAWWLTGSVALYSDALESIVNVAAAVAAFAAVRLSVRPADSNHPYGHHKAEYFSAVVEGVLIVMAALSIFHQAYQAFLEPRPLADVPLGLAVNFAAGLLNAGWALVLIRAGRRHGSPALAADGRHLLTDVLSSVGVIAGVGVAALTGIAMLDPILAVLVALGILWTGWSLTRSSVGGLMDEAAPAEVVERIRSIISASAEGALEAHDLRTRHAGRATFLDFHLVVPGTMTVSEAHDICDAIERALRSEIPETVISIHVEPDNKAKHAGIVVL
jgi:cation diffusion facilitator family transporter